MQELNLALPEPPSPLGTYVPTVEAGGLLFLSGMLPLKEQRRVWIGHVGRELTVAQGREAAKLAALNGLAVARAALGSLNRIRRLVRLTAHIAAPPEFGEHAAVADGASELLTELFKDGGGHARLAVGASSLPAQMPVEIELVFELVCPSRQERHSIFHPVDNTTQGGNRRG
jgi:enamine deaminase RidA (YjgF/YER057c/UK114 family)